MYQKTTEDTNQVNYFSGIGEQREKNTRERAQQGKRLKGR